MTWSDELVNDLDRQNAELLALVRKHLEDHLEACHITRRGEVCSLVAETRAVLAKAEGE